MPGARASVERSGAARVEALDEAVSDGLAGGSSYDAAVATGGIILAAIMLVALPVAIMFGGAIWTALMGWLLIDDADSRAGEPAESPD
jgi:hypothetical protein